MTLSLNLDMTAAHAFCCYWWAIYKNKRAGSKTSTEAWDLLTSFRDFPHWKAHASQTLGLNLWGSHEMNAASNDEKGKYLPTEWGTEHEAFQSSNGEEDPKNPKMLLPRHSRNVLERCTESVDERIREARRRRIQKDATDILRRYFAGWLQTGRDCRDPLLSLAEKTFLTLHSCVYIDTNWLVHNAFCNCQILNLVR